MDAPRGLSCRIPFAPCARRDLPPTCGRRGPGSRSVFPILELQSRNSRGYDPGMPTVLVMLGWRLFSCSNEGNAPVHVHARKGDAECKYWIRPEPYEIEEAYEYGLTPRLRREIRKIIYDHLEFLADERRPFFGG